jgi:hypothetical protein
MKTLILFFRQVVRVADSGAKPIEQLRQWMSDNGLEAVIVTSEDAHQVSMTCTQSLTQAHPLPFPQLFFKVFVCVVFDFLF